MKKLAIVDKQPGSTDYIQFFDIDTTEYDTSVHHLVSERKSKVLKKDVDLEFDVDLYDFVIVIGAEAAKFIAGVTGVTSLAGTLVNEKFIPMINPAILSFKPAMVDSFDRAVVNCKKILNGTSSLVSANTQSTECTKQAMEWLNLVSGLPDGSTVCLDTETSALYPRDGYLLGVSISWEKNQGVYISADVLDDRHCEKLQEIVDKKRIVFHNAKFDIKWMHFHLGLNFDDCDLHDTMMLHYLLDETQGTHGLKALAVKYTEYGDYDTELDEFKKAYCKRNKITQAEFSYSYIPFEIISEYAAIDTAVTWDLFDLFYPIVYKSKAMLLRVYNQIMIPGLRFLNDIEENGVPFCKERLVLGQKQMDEDIGKLKSKIYEYKEVKALEAELGKPFNPNSVQQLRRLLFTFCGLSPTGRLTGTGADSTDAIALQELSPQHPLPALILDVRQKTKIKSTYLDKILVGIDYDDKLRTGFNLTSTTSGRLSSSGKLNMQQLPRDNKLVKGCIKAPPGFKIVSQDLQTGEMYYAAVLSGDKKLQDVFVSGGDFHSTIAHQVFNLPCEISEVKSLYGNFRQAAKAISFGILYGSGPAKVAETVTDFNRENGIMEVFTVDDAKEAIKKYFKTYKRLKKWLDEQNELIRTQGFIYSALGRKRRLKDVFSSDKGLAASQVRSGVNFLVQSVSSDVNLLAAIDVHNHLKREGLEAKAQIIALVHDSILAVVAEDFEEEFGELMRHYTQLDRGLSIPSAPIGVDLEDGADYSFGGFEKQFPELFAQAA